MNNETEPNIQPYRWVQVVFSDFDDGMEMNIGTTSNSDRYHGLADLVAKHFVELTNRRKGKQPRQTWIGFTSSDGNASILKLEDFLKG